MEFTYAYSLLRGERGFILSFPDFPEILSLVTAEEIQSGSSKGIAYDALKHALQARMDFSDEIPSQTSSVRITGDYTVAVSPQMSSKIVLYQ